MSISLVDHEELALDVHAVRDRVVLTVNDQVIWLTGAEAEALRHKLMMATRAVTFPTSADIPAPRRD